MAAKLTRLTHKIAIRLHLVVQSCTICISRSRWPVRELMDTPSLGGSRVSVFQVSCGFHSNIEFTTVGIAQILQ